MTFSQKMATKIRRVFVFRFQERFSHSRCKYSFSGVILNTFFGVIKRNACFSRVRRRHGRSVIARQCNILFHPSRHVEGNVFICTLILNERAQLVVRIGNVRS
jgi:hypothetical protein